MGALQETEITPIRVRESASFHLIDYAFTRWKELAGNGQFHLSRGWCEALRYSTNCRFSAIRTPFTNTCPLSRSS